MRKIIFFTMMASVLSGCGHEEYPMASECREVVNIISAIRAKMEVSSYVPDTILTKYKHQSKEFVAHFEDSLKSIETQKQIESCQPMVKILKDMLTKLNAAKTEAEVKQIFNTL